MLIQAFTSAAPEVYAALGALGKEAVKAGLDPGLVELVKIRASQINGCAYCLSFHTAMARKAGVAQSKLDLLPAWRGAGIYDEKERAALGWTQDLTLMAGRHPDGEALAGLRRLFGEQGALHLTVAIGLINQWNRINTGLGIVPPEAASAEAASAPGVPR